MLLYVETTIHWTKDENAT